MPADIPTITSMPMEGPEKNSAIMDVVVFVEKHLAQFSERYAGSAIKNENGLNQELCVLLNYYARIECKHPILQNIVPRISGKMGVLFYFISGLTSIRII